GLDEMAELFLLTASEELGGRVGRGGSIARACLGIAGPIENNICRATNLPWVVDGRALETRLGIAHVRLVNDFYAAASAVTAVSPDALGPLGGPPPRPQ